MYYKLKTTLNFADVAKTTLRKLDNILYELSLSRKSRSSEDEGVGRGGGGNPKKDEDE